MPRPRLLFLTPHLPDPEGNGSSRRAHSTHAALSLTHEVTLLYVAPAPDCPPAPPPALSLPYDHANGALRRWRRRLARRHPALFTRLFAPTDWANHTPGRLRYTAALAASAAPFDTIHAFRLFVAPHALAVARALRPRPALHLDIDDIESLTRARIAVILEQAGDHSSALRERANTRAYARLERRLPPRFDRLYVASSIDASRIPHPGLRVLPNVVPVHPSPLPPPSPGPLRMLFIGALGYPPNQDAIRWFLAEIFPALRAATSCEFLVAGRHAPEPLRALLAATPGVVFLGPVECAASAYRDAHLVVAPLRAGGGTRLKILEAFALGRPVVATPLAAEGLEITPGRHALLADSAADFAAACAKLAADPDLRHLLAAQAREWVAARHSPAALAAPLA